MFKRMIHVYICVFWQCKWRCKIVSAPCTDENANCQLAVIKALSASPPACGVSSFVPVSRVLELRGARNVG